MLSLRPTYADTTRNLKTIAMSRSFGKTLFTDLLSLERSPRRFPPSPPDHAQGRGFPAAEGPTSTINSHLGFRVMPVGTTFEPRSAFFGVIFDEILDTTLAICGEILD